MRRNYRRDAGLDYGDDTPSGRNGRAMSGRPVNLSSQIRNVYLDYGDDFASSKPSALLARSMLADDENGNANVTDDNTTTDNNEINDNFNKTISATSVIYITNITNTNNISNDKDNDNDSSDSKDTTNNTTFNTTANNNNNKNIDSIIDNETDTISSSSGRSIPRYANIRPTIRANPYDWISQQEQKVRLSYIGKNTKLRDIYRTLARYGNIMRIERSNDQAFVTFQ